jgi:predicted transcriptional regulator YdeE
MDWEKERGMYTKEKQAERYVIGLKIRTSNDHHHQDGPPLWERFQTEHIAAKIPNKLNDKILAVYTDYESDYTKPYSYLVGCEVASLNEIPMGLAGIKIPPQQYAVFSAEGPFPQSMIQTWQQIWASDIERTYSVDFEIYSAHFNPQHPLDINIYIAVKH